MTNRTYRLWDYSASHAQLLLRSIPRGDYELNDDLIFGGVKYVGLPETILDVTVRQATGNEGAELSPAWAPQWEAADEPANVYLLEGTDPEGRTVQGLVVAESYRQEANRRDFFDSSLRHSMAAEPEGA